MTSGKLAEKLCSGNRARTNEASKRREPTMSLHPEQIGEVPEETARVAKACFPKGNRYMRLRDSLGTIFDDQEFADLFPVLATSDICSGNGPVLHDRESMLATAVLTSRNIGWPKGQFHLPDPPFPVARDSIERGHIPFALPERKSPSGK
jgi:hypothetical protein